MVSLGVNLIVAQCSLKVTTWESLTLTTGSWIGFGVGGTGAGDCYADFGP